MTQQNNEAFDNWFKNNYPNIETTSAYAKLPNKAWQAAIADSEREIAELKAHINVLREALGNIHQWYDGYSEHHINVPTALREIDNIATETLASTPEQSLQAHDNEVIERCAKVCDEISLKGSNQAYLLAKEIRALKVNHETT